MNPLSFIALKTRLLKIADTKGACEEAIVLVKRAKDMTRLVEALRYYTDWIDEKILDGLTIEEWVASQDRFPTNILPDNNEDLSKLELISEHYKNFTWFELKEMFENKK